MKTSVFMKTMRTWVYVFRQVVIKILPFGYILGGGISNDFYYIFQNSLYHLYLLCEPCCSYEKCQLLKRGRG